MGHKRKNVVVMGGGTGTHTVLTGLRQFHTMLTLTAVVSMSDSGGSTGRLRDMLGQLPVGDVRMALVALASMDEAHEQLMRALFSHRFTRGEGLSGHNFGNLFLSALTDITGSYQDAITAAARILNVTGTVLPVTYDNVHLTAEYDNGVTVTGECAIDAPSPEYHRQRITALTTTPAGKTTTEVRAAIEAADTIILGPGDLYTSVLANVVIGGVSQALRQSRATLVYVSNLMERPGQTVGMSLSQCFTELSQYVGRYPDVVVVNSCPLPSDVVEHYRVTEGTLPVQQDIENIPVSVVQADVLAATHHAQTKHDAVTRSLLRHDPMKLAEVLYKLIQ